MNVARIELQSRHRNKLLAVPKQAFKVNASAIFYKFAISCVVLAALFLGYLLERAIVSQNAINIEKMKKDLQVQEQQYQSLLINNACLKAPERIEQVAVEKLGMVVPDHINYIQLPSDYSHDNVEPAISKPFPVALAEDFWLSKILSSTDKTVKGAVTPGATAEARTD